MKHTRRSFLLSSAAAAAGATTPCHFAFADQAKPAPRLTPLNQFGYGDVTLLAGPLREQFDRNHAFYKALDVDMLLKPFRLRAGLPTPGDDMGGWYDWVDGAELKGMHGFAPAHSFGQYLSGLARDYAVTGDRATREKVQLIVREFGPAISEHFFAGNRFPAYTYDKISIGMIDAHQFAGDPNAFGVLDKTLNCAMQHLPPGGISRDEQYKRPHINESWCWDEPYTLPENFFLAYQRGAGSRYRDLGVRFLANDWYFDPLAAGENVLPGKHAYSHVNALSSAMQAYLTLNSDQHLRAAKNGFEFLRSTQSFATGGWGPDEGFRKPGSGEIGESIAKTHSSFETPCGSYAHFKITRYLLRATRDSLYGDSMERVLYNTVLGAKPIKEGGHGFYYSDYNNDGSKFYHPDKWTCCSGTFAQITADYGISAYFNDERNAYVNLYVPTRVMWQRGSEHVSLRQETKYPFVPVSEITVSTTSPSRFAMQLRIPAWAGPGTSISVNGKRQMTALQPGKFAPVEREWHDGDRVVIEFDMPTTLEAVDPQHPNLQAVVHGPLALFCVNPAPASVRKEELLTASQIAVGSSTWKAKTAGGTLTLLPFTAIDDEHYRLYLNVES